MVPTSEGLCFSLKTKLRTGAVGKWFLWEVMPRSRRRQQRREALWFCAPGAPDQLSADSGVVGLRTGRLGHFPHSLSGVRPQGTCTPLDFRLLLPVKALGVEKGWLDCGLR